MCFVNKDDYNSAPAVTEYDSVEEANMLTVILGVAEVSP